MNAILLETVSANETSAFTLAPASVNQNSTWSIVSSESLTNAQVDDNASSTVSPIFVPCDNPRDFLSPGAAEVVEIALYVGIFPVLVTCGIVGNVINILVFARQGLSDRINLCLFSLAFADTGFLLFLMCGKSYALVSLVHARVGNYWEQKHNQAVLGSCLAFIVLSNAITAIIAAERCVCVVSPFKAKKLLRTRYLGAVILLMGLYALVVKNAALSLKYEVEEVRDPAANGSTLYVTRLSAFYLRHKLAVDVVYSDLLSVAVPASSLVVVVLCTAVTILRLRSSLQWRRHHGLNEPGLAVTSASRRLPDVPPTSSVTSYWLAAVMASELGGGLARPGSRGGGGGSPVPPSNSAQSRPLSLSQSQASTAAEAVTSSTARSTLSSPCLMRSADKQEVAVTRMLVSVCCVYVICMTPSVSRTFVLHRVPEFLISGYLCNTFKVTTALVNLFEALNASINILIYFKQSSRFRDSLKRMLRLPGGRCSCCSGCHRDANGDGSCTRGPRETTPPKRQQQGREPAASAKRSCTDDPCSTQRPRGLSGAEHPFRPHRPVSRTDSSSFATQWNFSQV